jgi:hypothetical protein
MSIYNMFQAKLLIQVSSWTACPTVGFTSFSFVTILKKLILQFIPITPGS